jgi:hypothetical protein
LKDDRRTASRTQRAQIDDTTRLVELASPVLQELDRKTNWPSVLTVPRLDCMEAIETNSSQACFDLIRRRPIGYRLNYDADHPRRRGARLHEPHLAHPGDLAEPDGGAPRRRSARGDPRGGTAHRAGDAARDRSGGPKRPEWSNPS